MTVLTSIPMSTWAPPPHTVQAVDQDQIHQIPRWARSLPANVPSKKTRTPLFGTYYFNTETVFFGIRICWNQEITRPLYIWIFFQSISGYDSWCLSHSIKDSSSHVLKNGIPQLRKLPLAQPKNSPEKKKTDLPPAIFGDPTNKTGIQDALLRSIVVAISNLWIKDPRWPVIPWRGSHGCYPKIFRLGFQPSTKKKTCPKKC